MRGETVQSKTKAVVFDLGGTLIRETTWSEKTDIQKQVAAALLIPSDDFIPLWNATFNEQMKRFSKNCQAYLRQICQQLGVFVADKQIELAANIFFDMVKQVVMTPREEALEVLSCLKSNGYKIGLISNCSSEVPVIWENTSLAPLFDVVIFSCSIGLMKPDPKIYQLAIKQLHVNPDECLYITDGIGQELDNASKLGIQAIMLRVPGENDNDPYREQWNGLVIFSLREVLTLVT